MTITAWIGSGKRLPLLFEHSEVAVGHIDPGSMRESDDGLIVGGQVDRETEKGRQVWRQIKSGSIGFSIGYLATKSRPRPGGGRELVEIDLFEVSATSTPVNAGTRALSWKSARESEDEFNLEHVFLDPKAPEVVEAEAEEEPVQTKALSDAPIEIASFEVK